MEDKSENLNEQQNNMECLNNLKVYVTTKNEKEKNKLHKKLEIAKKNLIKSANPANFTRSAIIDYITKYSEIDSLSKNKNAKELVDEFIESFSNKNVLDKSLFILNNKFQEPSPFKTMLSFRNDINKEKQYLEFYFKVLLLLQNIENIIEGLNTQLGIKSKVVKKLLFKLSFQNPYSVILLRDLINEIILKQDNIEIEIVLNDIINNLKEYYLFHCPICFGLLYFTYDNIKNIATLNCPKDKSIFNPKDIKELKNILIFDMNCKDCNKTVEIYENNYKCMKCDDFICEQSAEDHEKSGIGHILIDLYKIGYICEEHFELYSEYCNLCRINLCKICIETHVHKVGQKMFILDENLFKKNSSKNINEAIEIKEYMLAKLSLMYKDMFNFSFINYSARVSIWLGEKFNRVNLPDTKKFYFDQFFNNDFKIYYSKLIKNVSKGKEKYYKLLIEIKKRYEKAGYNIDSSFDDFEEKYSEEKNNRFQKINSLVSRTGIAFSWIDTNSQITKLKNEIIILNNKIFKFQSDIQLLKIKILALLKSNNLYSSFLMKLLNRYLADFLLRKIIEKFPLDFYPIQISHNNFYEIATNFEDIMFKKNENSALLNDLINKLKLEKNKNGKNNKEKRKQFIKGLKDNNKIMFINPIKIKNEIFSIEEMNCVLDILFHFKRPGTIIAHMNISPNESIRLKNIDKDIPDIASILENIDNNNISNSTNNETSSNSNIIITFNNGENNIGQNGSNNNIPDKEMSKKIISNIENEETDWLEIKNEIIKEIIVVITGIKEQVLSDFYESSIVKFIKINDIINLIFTNNFSNIFTQNSAFTRSLSAFIDDMIKSSNINIDFSFFDQIKNLIWNTNKKIKSFDKWKNNMKKFDIKLPEKTYNQAKNYIKNYIKNVCKVNAQTKYISMNDNFSQIFDDLEEMDVSFPNCYEFEKTALLISFILPEIKKIELNNQDIFIKNFKESITKYFILFNVETIIEKLGEKIESFINIKIESNPAEEIEKLIKSKITTDSKINLNSKKICHIIEKIFENEKIEWTKLDFSDVSLESLLFYHQNKKA